MKKMKLLSLVLALMLLTGCARLRAMLRTGGASAGTESALPICTAAPEETAVAIVDHPGDKPAYRPLIDGSVSFEADAASKASVDFPADGTEKRVALKDGSGMTWELVIPADALDHPETITMTAMKNISSSLGKISGGVVLQPDGLRFAAPVTLTVKGAGIEKSGLLFSGNDKGSELELSIVQRNKDTVEMKLFHFSTAFGTDDSNLMNDLAGKAGGQRSEAVKAARELAKKPVEVPAPPAIPIKCHHNTEDRDQETINKFIEEFGKPESDVLSALLAAQRNLELITGETPDFTEELRLMSRLIKKADALIRQYKGQEEMFQAVAAAALDTERKYALLGGSQDASFLPTLAEWAQSIAQKYLDGLKNNHEYKNIHPIIKMSRYAALLGTNDNANFMDELAKALTFRLESKNTLKIGTGDSIVTYVVETRADVKMLNVSANGVISANGTGTYTSFEVPLLNDTELKMELDQLGKSFPVVIGIEGFMPCMSDTFTIYVDRFGAESETITGSAPGVPSSSKTMPVVQNACEKGFEENKKEGAFAFTVDVHDGQKVAAEKTFTASSKGMDIEYTLKLIHTP